MSQARYLYVSIVIALIVSQVPILNVPFMWYQTFFHELSHGLAALLTGGEVVSIELSLNGSGLCFTRGGFRSVVLFSGYAGATLLGYMLFRVAILPGHTFAHASLVVLMVILASSTLMWARDIVTIVICILLIGVLYAGHYLRKYSLAKIFISVVSMFVILDSIKSPLYLLSVDGGGDAEGLSEVLIIPELIWVLLWVAMSLMVFISLFSLTRKEINV